MNPNILNYLPRYPSINDPNFNRTFNDLVEFKVPAVPKSEEFPKVKGDRMSHQIIISRIMSSKTPYDGMLLMHEMGTGKTCTAVSIIEQLRSEADSGINKFYFVTKNNDLGANFEYEYKNVCVKGDIKSTGVSTRTYKKFLEEFTGNNNLEGSVVVIDEVHNIKTKIRQYIDILTNPKIKNLKVVLLSGTPMTDDPREIEDIMNLITRDKSQHMKNEPGFYDVLTPEKTELLRKAFRGRVSYMKAMETPGLTSTLRDKSTPEDFKHFKLHAADMSDHQFKYYKAALESDLGEVDSSDKSAAYSNSRQASNFVDENGNYTIDSLRVNRPMMKIEGSSIEAKLKSLSKYSSKYAASVRTIIEARKQKKNVFVYNMFVKGGGLSVFASILDRFGFSRVRVKGEGVVADRANPNRYMLMTGNTPTSEKQALLQRFNREDNIDGDYIGVVLVSDAISEGYSFKNIQVVDIQTPWFQYAKITQAIARGIRFGSHKALLARDKKVNVDVYLRVATTPKGSGVESIDVKTYSIAESKDIVVKQIEYIIKQEAIDAVAMRIRNSRGSEKDGTRECEYTTCDYDTHPMSKGRVGGVHKDDYSNFLLYYNADDESLRRSIVALFKDRYSIRFNEIVIKTAKNVMPVLAAIHTLISTNEPVIMGDKKFYIREDKDIYYLTQEIANNTSSMDLYYNGLEIETDIVEGKSEIKFDIMDVLTDDTLNTVDDLICVFVNNPEYATPAQKERLLERVVTTSDKSKQIDLAKTFFGGMYGTIDGVLYSWYPKHSAITKPASKKIPCRKLVPGGSWEDATDEEFVKIQNYVASQKLKMEEKALAFAAEYYGEEMNNIKTMYYGLYDYNEKKCKPPKGSRDFKIVSFEREKSTDKRDIPTGVNCKSFVFPKDEKEFSVIFNLVGYGGDVPFKKTKAEQCAVLEAAMAAVDDDGLITRYVANV